MMMNEYDKPLYVLPFDHSAAFETRMFGSQSALAPGQSAPISRRRKT